MASLENAIVRELKDILKNRKLTKKSLMEWSSGAIEPQEGEVVVQIPDLGIYAAVKKEDDKRGLY